MRFIFKTDYAQDIDLAKHSGHVVWYGLLIAALLVAPWVVPEYWLAQLTFVLIYAIVGLGLMLLAGFTGLRRFGDYALPCAQICARSGRGSGTCDRGRSGRTRRAFGAGARRAHGAR